MSPSFLKLVEGILSPKGFVLVCVELDAGRFES
jgi:hypothetical protein